VTYDLLHPNYSYNHHVRWRMPALPLRLRLLLQSPSHCLPYVNFGLLLNGTGGGSSELPPSSFFFAGGGGGGPFFPTAPPTGGGGDDTFDIASPFALSAMPYF
jgi:hypothetical protein